MPEDGRERPREKSLSKALTHVLEECRMVLPGIQALFGFQLIAVFNAGFVQLVPAGQVLHLVAIVLVAIAVALVMAPAAYHRQCLPEGVTEDFILLASRLLLASMVPLGAATVIDVFLIASIVLERSSLAVVVAGVVAATFFGLWVVLPWLGRRSASGTERSGGPRKIRAHAATQD